MKKVLTLILITILCLSFAGCGSSNESQETDMSLETNESVTETPAPATEAPAPATEAHVHEFGDWETTQEPTYTSEGTKTRYCSCGESQSDTLPKKTPQTVTINKDNFKDYFKITYNSVYDEYFGGKIFNYGHIDVTVTCVQSVKGDIENVTAKVALYPRGGRWDVTNYTDVDRELELAFSVSGSATGMKQMGFATTQGLYEDDVRKPDSIDFEILSASGTITIYP